MARRPHGTGGVYQECTPTCPDLVETVTADGKRKMVRPEHKCPGRWIASIDAGYTAKGTRRRIKVTAKTKGEVISKQREKQRQIATDGLPVAGASSRATVSAWAKAWVGRRAGETRHTTTANDTSAVRRWIVPTIGHKRLDTLTPADVRAVTSAITSAGRSSSTALRAQVVLTKMLRDAILEGHQVPQRVLMVPAPAVAVSDRDAIPLLDAHKILRAAAERPDASRWVAALLQAMRPGECLGLTWPCIDWDADLIRIEWQLDEIPYNVPRDRSSDFRIKPGLPHVHLVDRWHLVPPKTKTGVRVIPMVPWMRAALLEWQKIAPANPWGLVWPAPDGSPGDDRVDRDTWRTLQQAAGVTKHLDELDAGGRPVTRSYTLYEARHTTATLLLEAGVDEHVVTAIMGHSSIITSRGYQHVSQTLARKALDDVADRLGLTLSDAPKQIEG